MLFLTTFFQAGDRHKQDSGLYPSEDLFYIFLYISLSSGRAQNRELSAMERHFLLMSICQFVHFLPMSLNFCLQFSLCGCLCVCVFVNFFVGLFFVICTSFVSCRFLWAYTFRGTVIAFRGHCPLCPLKSCESFFFNIYCFSLISLVC